MGTRSSAVAPGARGSVILRDPAVQLVAAWRRVLSQAVAPLVDARIDAPAFLAPRVLRVSGYAKAFPQHVLRVRGRNGQTMALAPAACLHVYPLLERTRIRCGRGILVESRCARFEGGRWRSPYRLLDFRMLELVLVGERRWVARRLARAEAAVDRLCADLGADATWRPATDPFFGKGARMLQRITDAKRELEFSKTRGVAVASSNRHGDHFTRAFRIANGEGDVASACLAFGLERLAAASLATWGPHPRAWPRKLRS